MGSAVRRIILIQVAVTVAMALLMLVRLNAVAAASAFAGGAVGFLTSLVYAKKMFAPLGSEPEAIISAHYRAEAYKLVFTILLFSLVFTQFKEVHVLPLFVAYIATLMVYWVALIFV
ncbi:ATP synthase protein I [Candidatus Nitrotoga sp. BS]|uniref:ATP synthase subunit I n=1 Tax=Candidatus Nitrotoga sp. BS TaxID=2890408 RepID=UPI001EF3814D|nr:ATP synthase subunit I [Candidatus Nitrotoga sp. BS]CAH1203163.1 ATP synthase protein I [Candidatus Nitrotoga sp. BS]